MKFLNNIITPLKDWILKWSLMWATDCAHIFYIADCEIDLV
jgi:hypothetical protein